jgi:hypothetical protein
LKTKRKTIHLTGHSSGHKLVRKKDMMNIELKEFLKWAFAIELVHVATAESGSMTGRWADMLSLGTVVDKFGGPLAPDMADVHPDAIAASEAVMTLPLDVIDLPMGVSLFPDLDDEHGLIAQTVDEVMTRRAMRDAASLHANSVGMLIHNSVLGKEPLWQVDDPSTRMVMRAGKPGWFIRRQQTDAFGRAYDYEADGYDARAGRPMPGAYRKYELSEPFGGHVQDRIDWMLWARMLTVIAEKLSTGLKSHRIKPFAIDVAPWENRHDAAQYAQPLENAAF